MIGLINAIDIYSWFKIFVKKIAIVSNLSI